MPLLSLLLCASCYSIPLTPTRIVLPAAAVISAEGDSLTYGQDTASAERSPGINGAPQTRSVTPYPETLAQLLGVRVINRGFPGDQTVQGLKRWDDVVRPDLAILMYGTNDWGNFGGYKEGPVKLEMYKTNLATLIKRRLEQGARVIVLSPPPIDAKRVGANGKALAPISDYVAASREVAAKLGVLWVDLQDVPGTVETPYTDGLHFTPALNRALAAQVAKLIDVR